MQKEDNIAGEMCSILVWHNPRFYSNFAKFLPGGGGECQIMATRIETNTLFSQPFIHNFTLNVRRTLNGFAFRRWSSGIYKIKDRH